MTAPTLPASLAATVDAVLAALRAAGLQAALSLAELDPPGVLLTVPAIGFRFGRCHDATFIGWALVPGLDRGQALGQLAAVLETAATALGGSPWPLAEADDLGPPSGGVLPAYRIEFTRRITAP